jgi:hypothetical protein
VLAPLPPELLDAVENQDAWSPIAVLRHVVWCEEQSWVARIRTIRDHGVERAVAGLDRDAGFQRYAGWSVDRLLTEFARLRAERLDELDRLWLTDADFARPGQHPRFGAVTLGQLLATWATHDVAHLAQITRTLTRAVGAHAGPWRVNFSLLRD